jgi:phage baseplate assembly protein W
MRKFKSVGKTNAKLVEENTSLTSSQLPIGILTPLQLGDRKNGTLRMSWSLIDQIADNLRNLILTNWGERLGNYYFGANLKEISTEIVNQENYDSLAMERIKSAVSKWMPYVNLLNFSSSITTDSENSPTGKITLYILIECLLYKTSKDNYLLIYI